MASVFLGKDDVYYQFQYAYVDKVGGADVDIVTTECIVFNDKKMTLQEAQRLFIKDKPKGGRLSVSNECDTNVLGLPKHKKVRIPVQE